MDLMLQDLHVAIRVGAVDEATPLPLTAALAAARTVRFAAVVAGIAAGSTREPTKTLK
jgi:hypothetical protein